MSKKKAATAKHQENTKQGSLYGNSNDNNYNNNNNTIKH
jgi:hypothetical protein